LQSDINPPQPISLYFFLLPPSRPAPRSLCVFILPSFLPSSSYSLFLSSLCLSACRHRFRSFSSTSTSINSYGLLDETFAYFIQTPRGSFSLSPYRSRKKRSRERRRALVRSRFTTGQIIR